MAFVSGYKWDLFVSYAHADDEAVWGKGWVTDLVDRLTPMLRMRLGTNNLEVFRDGEEVAANYDLEQLLTAVRSSALFLAIGSPSYVTRPWTLDEARAFKQAARDSSRLFSIECLPLTSGSYPPELAPKIQQWFWAPSGERKIPATLTAESNLYREKLEALADDISQKLAELNAKSVPTHSLSMPSTAAMSSGKVIGANGKPLKKILLAKTVGALEEELDGLRNTLLQFNDELTVVSAGDYPLGGPEFCASFLEDLQSTDMFVQLLGKAPAKTPPDLPEGYTRFQVRQAAEMKVPILQWRPADLDLTTVTDPDYLTMLEAETVEVSGMEALKKKILDFARKDPPVSRDPSQGTVLFIAAHSTDRELAERLKKELINKPVEVRFAAELVGGEGHMSSEELRSDLTENLADSDILVFLYRQSTHQWIRAKLMSLSKARSITGTNGKKTKKLEVVYIGPPTDKPDPGIYLPNVQMVPCPPDGDLEPLLNLIRQAGVSV